MMQASAIRPETSTAPATARELSWSVVVLNDPVNLMSYVTHVLRRIFGYPEAHARRLMLEVHTQGRSVVWQGERATAEGHVRELHQWQLQAVLESADAP